MKNLLTQAKTSGVDIDGVAVDKTLKANFSNFSKIASTSTWGFAKCHFTPDNAVESYAENKILASFKTVGKYALKIINVKDIITCYFESNNEAWTSEAGVYIIKQELEVMGVNEILNTIE